LKSDHITEAASMSAVPNGAWVIPTRSTSQRKSVTRRRCWRPTYLDELDDALLDGDGSQDGHENQSTSVA
jgi:hypothetical protein